MPFVRHSKRRYGQPIDPPNNSAVRGSLGGLDATVTLRLVQLEEHRALHPYRRRPVTLPKLKWMEPR